MIGADFIGDERCALVLGDNIFYGQGLGLQLERFADLDGAAVFAYWVDDPHGVRRRRVRRARAARSSLEEKPEKPRSNYAVPGPVLLRQRRGRDRPRASSRPRAASTRSPTSTGPTSSAATLHVQCSPAAPPGWTPAPSSRSTTPATSSATVETGKASRSARRRRSPGGRASSPTTSCATAPRRCSRAATATTCSACSNAATSGVRRRSPRRRLED